MPAAPEDFDADDAEELMKNHLVDIVTTLDLCDPAPREISLGDILLGPSSPGEQG